MRDIAISRNGVRIRLTNEGWSHVIEEHCELADLRVEVLEAISSPVRIFVNPDTNVLLAANTNAGDKPRG